jgi:DNA-binding NarL/FixJ family response regulator
MPGKNNVLRVVIADDSASMRSSLRRFIRSLPGIELVGEAENGTSAVDLVQTLHPDVLLLDVEMPEMDGIETVRRLGELGCQVQVLMVSAFNDPHLILTTLEEGAAGYLVKNDAPVQLKEAILSVGAGRRNWTSREAAAALAL